MSVQAHDYAGLDNRLLPLAFVSSYNKKNGRRKFVVPNAVGKYLGFTRQEDGICSA